MNSTTTLAPVSLSKYASARLPPPIRGVGITFDLSKIADTRIRDIEGIDLTGSGNNRVTLSRLEVVNLSTTSNTLTVDGNAGTTLDFSGEPWTDKGTSGGYTRFVNGQAIVPANTAITVTGQANAAPTIGGTVGDQSLDDTTTGQPLSDVTIGDTDPGAAETVTITLTSGGAASDANGTLSGSGLSKTGVWAYVLTASGIASDANGLLSGTGLTKTGVGTYVLAAGTPASVTAALRALVFTPSANQAAPIETVTTGMILSVNDRIAGSPTRDLATTVVTTSINDAPAIDGATGPLGVCGTVPLAALQAIDISERDPNQDVNPVILPPGSGTLTGFTVGSFDPASGVYRVTGRPDAITAQPRGLLLRSNLPTEGFVGTTVQIGMQVTDSFAPVSLDSAARVTPIRQALHLASLSPEQIAMSPRPAVLRAPSAVVQHENAAQFYGIVISRSSILGTRKSPCMTPSRRPCGTCIGTQIPLWPPAAKPLVNCCGEFANTIGSPMIGNSRVSPLRA